MTHTKRKSYAEILGYNCLSGWHFGYRLRGPDQLAAALDAF